VGVLDASTSPPKERYAVPQDNVIKLIQPGFFDDQLTGVLRNGARALLAKAIEAEVADSTSMPIRRPETASSGWSATVTCRNAR
jgi:hypothetical protein